MRRLIRSIARYLVQEILSTNLAALMAMSGQWVDRIRQRRSLDKLILDPDSSVSETCGRRERPCQSGAGDPVACSQRVNVPRSCLAEEPTICVENYAPVRCIGVLGGYRIIAEQTSEAPRCTPWPPPNCPRQPLAGTRTRKSPTSVRSETLRR